MIRLAPWLLCGLVLLGCRKAPVPEAAAEAPAPGSEVAEPAWQTDFLDEFDSFDEKNWRDQILWVNNEDQCYVRDGAHGVRVVEDGLLKLRVVDLGEPRPCDNRSKTGERHPDTRYVAGRVSTKNRQEFVGGRWTARLRVPDSGTSGMFPAWWLLGARNDEPPVEEADEDVCWPLVGSGEIDIFEHHSDGGADHYAARTIENLGACDSGDWQSQMLVQSASLGEFHDYGVEWQGQDLVFLLDGTEVHRARGQAPLFPEPFFAILNFAKINDAAMDGPWVMEVDWVKHERRAPAGD